MGSFCSGGSGPDLDVNADKINEMINESLAGVEAKSTENVETFSAGIAEAGDEAYKVPDSDPAVELTGESTEQEVGMAAVAAAFGGVKTDDLKASIWTEVEKHLDSQIEKMEEEKKPSEEEIAGTKKDIKERDVDGAVDTAFADKRAELEKSYEPEPVAVEEDKPAEEENQEDDSKVKEDAAADDAADDDAAKKEEDGAAKEEEPAADDAAKEEEPAAEKEAAADEPAAEEEAAADEPAADEAGD